MKRFIKPFFDRMPYIKDLREQVEKQGAFPAGHYYSPVPDKQEIHAYIESRNQFSKDLQDVDLNSDSQFRLLNEYVQFYKDLPFPEKQRADCRYYYDNKWFSYADAVFLYSFLRKHQPKGIVEIGSGFSSAVMLDTVDRFLPNRPEITFIEPYPDRLKSLLRGDDVRNVRILDKKLQEVSSGVFSSLEAGDLLFVDSSHVMKCGSDLHLLIFDILPSLPPGIFVHFHDVFYPFDYPPEWLKGGRYWNENYFLRAFLSYNHEWSIYFFTTYVASLFADFLKEKMPLCARNPGGGLYIQREKRG